MFCAGVEKKSECVIRPRVTLCGGRDLKSQDLSSLLSNVNSEDYLSNQCLF